MKLKWNTARVILAAALGSVFWAGCASSHQGPGMVENTVDLQSTGPDTHPENRTGLYNFNSQDYSVKAIE